MILLDTNVVSEVMRPAPSTRVIDWLNAQRGANLHFSAISVAEIEFGIDVLPAGKRRQSLRARFEDFLRHAFSNRILAFDDHAAQLYGPMMGDCRRAGRPASTLDGQIAAIARHHGMAVATRNISDFREFGLDLIDPWTAG